MPLGGAGLRGYDAAVAVGSHIVALNAEQSARLVSITSGPRPLAFWGTLFAGGGATQSRTLADGGVGVMARGWLFDRDVRVRVDLPVYVSEPLFAGGRSAFFGRRRNPSQPTGRWAADRVQLTLGSFW